MKDLKYIDSITAEWKIISDGVEQLVLRLEPGEGVWGWFVPILSS